MNAVWPALGLNPAASYFGEFLTQTATDIHQDFSDGDFIRVRTLQGIPRVTVLHQLTSSISGRISVSVSAG